MVKPLSPIELAVLGLISGKTMGGPELQEIYQKTNSAVWPSRPNGIWEVAARLVKMGYLEDRGDRDPQRWSITEFGVDALSHAVSTADPKPAVRFPIFVVCAYLEYARDWDAAEEVLRAHKTAWENALATEHEVLDGVITARSPLVRARLDRSPPPSIAGTASQLVKTLALQGQVGLANTMIDWAAESLHRIAELRVHGELPPREPESADTSDLPVSLSPIEIAVLGLIGANPAGISGSDMTEQYRATSAKLWPSKDHGLYPVAVRLKENEFIHDKGVRHPNRFSITDAGIEALSNAVMKARPKPAVRFPIFVTCAYFEYARDWAAVERVLQNHHDAWLNVLTGAEHALGDIVTGRAPILLQQESRDPHGIRVQASKLTKTLAFRGEVAIAEFMLRWADTSLGAIRRLRADMGELTLPPLPERKDSQTDTRPHV